MLDGRVDESYNAPVPGSTFYAAQNNKLFWAFFLAGILQVQNAILFVILQHKFTPIIEYQKGRNANHPDHFRPNESQVDPSVNFQHL